MLREVLRLCCHSATGPNGVFAQSSERMRALILLLPAKISSGAAAGFPFLLVCITGVRISRSREVVTWCVKPGLTGNRIPSCPYKLSSGRSGPSRRAAMLARARMGVGRTPWSSVLALYRRKYVPKQRGQGV